MATDYPEVTKDRLRRALRRLILPAVHRPLAPLRLEALHVAGEPIRYEDAIAQAFQPFGVGDAWGSPWGTTWFHVVAEPPEGAAGDRLVALFDLGFQGDTGFTVEALAWRDGRPWRGVSPNHRWLPLEGTSPAGFYLEAAANPVAGVDAQGRGASMLALREQPAPAFTLREASLAVQDQEVRALAVEFGLLLDLALALPAGEAAAGEILAALNRGANLLDPDAVAATAAAARAELQEVLARRNGTAAHQVTAIGHAHIDTAWLWPVREAKRKCARTFATALALMDEYPEYRFACSQPVQYEWMKQDYPSIHEGIKRRVAEGRWEPVGAMYVEADCNIPSGEALARQIVHGKRFFMDEFGIEPCEVWLPDVFGYSAALPQLIVESGSRYFLTQKLSWNQFNRPMHHTFWWEGIDGTRVFTHFPPADTYNGDFTTSELLGSSRRFLDHGRSSHSLYLFGHGDGGGGPEPDMLEAARRLEDLEGLPRVRLDLARRFFEDASAEARELAVWSGELYFELHRGTYTTQARTKSLNRRAEVALREAEMWSAATPETYPAAQLDAAWKTLLLNQFHDILPGSSIDWVYEEAERDLRAVTESASLAASGARQRLAGQGDETVVFNSSAHARAEVLDVDGAPRWVQAPPCGWASQSSAGEAPDGVTAGDGFLENGLLRVRWDSDGLLTSIWDKEARREVLEPGARGNLFQLHSDLPVNWDAWDVDIHYSETGVDLVAAESVEVVETHPLRAAVRIRRRFGASAIDQRMVLEAGSRVLRFETVVDWQENRKFLKVAFPVGVRAARATYEIQFGHVERPTHRNTSWDMARFEVCAQRWADLGEPGYGVALLNDCKYGYDIQGSTMRLSLLRATAYPDPNADRGHHRFTYALLPHAGDFREAGVIQAAEALNQPLQAVRGAAGSHSLLQVDTPQVAVTALKVAEDGDGLVVRVHEAWGGRCRARLSFGLPVGRAWLCDLLERPREEIEVQDGAVELSLLPFKIATLRLR